MPPAPTRPCITGIGAITPIGHDPDSFWDALLAGRPGAAPVRSFDTSDLKRSVGCEVGDYDLPESIRQWLQSLKRHLQRRWIPMQYRG